MFGVLFFEQLYFFFGIVLIRNADLERNTAIIVIWEFQQQRLDEIFWFSRMETHIVEGSNNIQTDIANLIGRFSEKCILVKIVIFCHPLFDKIEQLCIDLFPHD